MIIPKMVAPRFRRTDRECPHCGEPSVVKDEKKLELFCANCHTVLDREVREDESEDEWKKFRKHRRENYSGWHGPDRIKFVGGFAKPYVFEDDF